MIVIKWFKYTNASKIITMNNLSAPSKPIFIQIDGYIDLFRWNSLNEIRHLKTKIRFPSVCSLKVKASEYINSRVVIWFSFISKLAIFRSILSIHHSLLVSISQSENSKVQVPSDPHVFTNEIFTAFWLGKTDTPGFPSDDRTNFRSLWPLEWEAEGENRRIKMAKARLSSVRNLIISESPCSLLDLRW